MNAETLKKKEAVEGELKREAQKALLPPGEAEAGGGEARAVKDEKAPGGQKQPRKFPKFLVFFQMQDFALKKKIVSFKETSNLKVSAGGIAEEFESVLARIMATRLELEKSLPIPSRFEGVRWCYYVNKKKWIYVLLYDLRTRNFEIEQFFKNLDTFIQRLQDEKGQSDDQIKQNLPNLMAKYFELTSNVETSGNKFDKVNEQIAIALDKIEVTLDKVNKNMMNMDVANKVAEKANKEAAEFDANAKALADAIGSGNLMMTIILIVVAVLLAVAVFANLYATINAPPPPPYPYPPPRKQLLVPGDRDREIRYAFTLQPPPPRTDNRPMFKSLSITTLKKYI